MATSSPIGFLVPLKNVNSSNLEEEEEESNNNNSSSSNPPKLSLTRGVNYVGRDCLPVSDKRLSRRHLRLTSSPDGSLNLFVEGTNPVVVRSKNERKKLLSGDTWIVRGGDVLELIPGHHFFKYVSLSNYVSKTTPTKRPLNNEEGGNARDLARGSKRTQKDELSYDVREPDNSGEGIRNFRFDEDKLPLTFRLLRVKELPQWANTNAVSISDVVQGNILVAILSNYMVDIDWLLSECPMLKKVPHVLVIHGEGDGTLEYMKRKKPPNWILHKPPLPISFGTHHSKAMLLVYPRGVRVIVHTANLIYVDWNNKSQGLWMQDFPWKDRSTTNEACGFENDLVDYLSTLKWPQFNVDLPAIGSFNVNASFFRKFDYSSATVRLIASVPGYHSGASLRKWGHMKLRTVLQECTFDKEFEKSPLIYQFSSLGSLDEKWMSEFASSMSAGMTEDKKPLGLGRPLIIWPTVEDVRCSIEGYAAGNAIPSPLKNVEKEFLKKYWAQWKARHTGRCRAMPHIKTFTRYNGQNLAWFLLTSANLSKAAWGALQKNNSQLMIRSYELGVLFLPLSGKYQGRFSCTSDGNSVKGDLTPGRSSEMKKAKLVTLAWERNNSEESGDEVIQLPVPYELPPKPYSPQDIPWSWDRSYTKKDVYGEVWPRQVKLYACQDI